MQHAATSAPEAPGTRHLGIEHELTEHIGFVRHIARGDALPDAARVGYLARCAAIEARLRDPRLWLAVIGEFSAGKSTLINALIGRELFKSSLAVTTASVTQIERGDRFRIEATFRDGTAVAAREQDVAEMRARLAPWAPALSPTPSMKELLDHLTAAPAVARHVAKVCVTLPGDGLPENLVIVDTPGISPGARDATEHRELTERVMSDIADAALVLVPSFAAMSRTLIGFLHATAQRLLHRCMFLVTALDRIAAADQPALIAYVRAEIDKQLGLVEPVVLGASALAMLPAPTHDDPFGADRSRWQAEFRSVEHSVTQTLARHRPVILAETTTRLLQDLLGALRAELASKQSRLADEAERLAESSLSAIDLVLAEVVDHCREQIEAQRRALIEHARTQRSVYGARAKQAAYEALEALGWSISNSEQVETTVRGPAQVQGSAYLDGLNAKLGELRACCERLVCEFAGRFEASYRALPALRTDVVVPAIAVEAMPAPALAFGSLRTYLAEQDRQDNRGAAAGAGAGAMIGALAGPIGILFGAAVGSVVGLLQAGDSLEQRQSQLRRYAGAEIDNHLERTESAATAHVERIAADCLRQFRAAGAAHQAQYGERIAALIRAHEASEEALRRSAADVAACTAEVDRRIRRLATFAETLNQL